MDGVERVYGSEYDEARRYIRKPKRDEEWPIGQHVISLTHLPKKVLGGIYESDVDEYVGLRFFSIVFFVDLLRKGDFTTFLRDHQPPGTLLLEPGLCFQGLSRMVCGATALRSARIQGLKNPPRLSSVGR
jgi:hypothetical protein